MTNLSPNQEAISECGMNWSVRTEVLGVKLASFVEFIVIALHCNGTTLINPPARKIKYGGEK